MESLEMKLQICAFLCYRHVIDLKPSYTMIDKIKETSMNKCVDCTNKAITECMGSSLCGHTGELIQ